MTAPPDRWRWFIPAAVIAALVCGGAGGCASGISKAARSQVTYTGDFKSVQADPDRFTGQVVHWGGRVVENRSVASGSELVLLALPVSRWGRPGNVDDSPGRYLLRSDVFLDPAVYAPGARVTVVGRLNGSQAGHIGERAYTFPVVQSIELKKWATRSDQPPRFHFGIGIGTTF